MSAEKDLSSKRCHAAVDLGASSGRVVLGYLDEGTIRLEEVHRFENHLRRVRGHDCWDLDELFENIVEGLARCKSAFNVEPVSVGVDTWAVDYVLLDEWGEVVCDPISYRDPWTKGVCDVVGFLVSPSELYRRTGIQRQPFNTLYQLLALKRERPEQLAFASRLLMIPDYLNWRLSGVAANEYTNASTTALLDTRTKKWDAGLLNAYSLPSKIFSDPLMPGTELGPLTAEIAERVGYQTTVVLPATHDTGSAFVAVPARDEGAVFLSSGTWSLLGVENREPVTTEESRLKNFTNEGGYDGTYRYLKNIMGLWMIQSVRREINGESYVKGTPARSIRRGERLGFGELSQMARDADPIDSIIDVDDERFLAPESMIREVKAACASSGQRVPRTTGELMRVIYQSLAHSYASAIEDLSELTGRTYTSINVVGGGCQDAYLNQLTADVSGLPVIAGPVEATCLGNLVVQMISAGELADVGEARACIARSFDVRRFDPKSA